MAEETKYDSDRGEQQRAAVTEDETAGVPVSEPEDDGVAKAVQVRTSFPHVSLLFSHKPLQLSMLHMICMFI